MRLLLVEDDLAIQEFLSGPCPKPDIKSMSPAMPKPRRPLPLRAFTTAFIIDLGLPDPDGLDLIARCREHGSSIPVLILSARRSVDERVLGLEKGGDDYLTKPFALSELLARLRNLLRRSSSAAKRIRPPAGSPISNSIWSVVKPAAANRFCNSRPRNFRCWNIFDSQCRPRRHSHHDSRSCVAHAY